MEGKNETFINTYDDGVEKYSSFSYQLHIYTYFHFPSTKSTLSILLAQYLSFDLLR